MEFTYESIMGYLGPVLKTFLWSLFALIIVVGIGYFVIVYMKQRKWNVFIWEEKANGAVYLAGHDILVEKKYNRGKQKMYWLKRARCETLPPPVDCVDRYKNKLWTNYVRVLDDVIPMRRNIYYPTPNKTLIDTLDDTTRRIYIKAVKDAIKDIRKLEKDEAPNNYIYAPIDRTLIGKMVFQPIEYDVNMMRINAIDNRDKIYADKKTFWENYGHYIAIGVIIVLIIVVVVLSYEYSAKVLQQSFAAADQVGGPLGKLVEQLGGQQSPPPG